MLETTDNKKKKRILTVILFGLIACVLYGVGAGIRSDIGILLNPLADYCGLQYQDVSMCIANTEIDGLEPGQTDKYTIVMWIEGEDPECLDVIRDGYVKMMWFFNIADEEL